MLNGIIIGQYFPGQSILHRLDPRTKIFGTAIFIISIFLANTALPYSAVIGFCLFAMALSQLSVRIFWGSIKPLWIIVAFTWGIHLFSEPGEVIFRIGPLGATYEGLWLGFFMSSHLVLLVAFSSLLTFTTSPLALTDGIEQILKPLKKIGIPAHELAMMMTIALRFIPTLLEETDRIMKAQTARGADFSSGGLIKRARNMVPLLVPLFISAFRRADDLVIAMEARCYRGGENRTRMKKLRLGRIDWICSVALLIYLGGIIYLWQGSYGL